MNSMQAKHLHGLCEQYEVDRAEIDTTLTYSENKHHLQQVAGKEPQHEYSQDEVDAIMSAQEDLSLSGVEQAMQDNLGKSICFLILGRRGNGKTTLGFRLLERHHLAGRPCLIFRHPNPKVLPKWIRNFTVFTDTLPEGAVILVDEAAKYFHQHAHAKKINLELQRWLETTRQREQSLILIAHNSRFINLNLFELVDVMLMKQPTLSAAKEERPTTRALYQDYDLTTYGVDEFLYYDGKEVDRMKFEKPVWVTDELSKPYRKAAPIF